MKIRKAVLTAAGKAQRTVPLQRLVDVDGREKTALQIIAEEITSAGIEDISVIICPGDQDAYRDAAGEQAGRIRFVEQHHPRGYGDALLRAQPFLQHEPFLHCVGDHLWVSAGKEKCAQQLVQAATEQSCSVSAVQATRESKLPLYGCVGGKRLSQEPRLYLLETVLEKPTPTQAEQQLLIPGLRTGHYLCFFGMHVLTPSLLDILAQLRETLPDNQNLSLSPALALLAQRERYLAYEVLGTRYNIGVKYGLLTAQLALAMAGKDREEVLAQLVELLATAKRA